jgi:hypothetical protein
MDTQDLIMRAHLFLIFCLVGLPGCSTVNFSANYYTPPGNYQAEVKMLLDNFAARAAFTHTYGLEIVSERGSQHGIPSIRGVTIRLPDNFIKYVYQNYYRDRLKVLLCTVAHEISHVEYSLIDQSSPKAHFKVDQKAIELLQKSAVSSPGDYYKSLWVLRNYWFARKGLGGHVFNVSWNLANAASMAYGGPGYFGNWFATDLDARLALISKQFKVKSRSCFKRSTGDNKNDKNFH